MKLTHGCWVLVWWVMSLILSGCGGGNGATPTPQPTTLTSISVIPSTSTVTKGQSAVLTATGHYSDSTTVDVTSQVTWASGNTAVATIANSTGIVTGAAVGSTTITATLNGITSIAVNLNITAAVITGISINPTTSSAPKGSQVTFTATGPFSDGTSGNISGSVNWLSSDVAVATINASGIATPLASGSTNITASASGFTSNSASLIVSNTPPAVSLIVTQNNPASPALLNLSAIAADMDGSTTKVEFFNGGVLLATVTQAPYTYNWNNVAAGTYTISARATDNLGATSANTVANRVTVTVAGTPSNATPFQIAASRTMGLAPLSVDFAVQNLLTTQAVTVRADFLGNGQFGSAVSLQNGATLSTTYTQPGRYLAQFEVTDTQGKAYQLTQELVVETPAVVNANLVATYNGMMQVLLVNDATSALNFMTDGAHDKYAVVFTALGSRLASATSRLGTLSTGLISDDLCEYYITRNTPNGQVAFPIYFMRGDDGLWRIDSM